ncbi:MAG: hypothetical protein ACXWT0_08955 [Methylobacter sp.]
MPQPSITPLEAARAKQLEIRRKMQNLPKQPVRAAMPNIDWHSHFMQRVAK